jgi:hypothetical protein
MLSQPYNPLYFRVSAEGGKQPFGTHVHQIDNPNGKRWEWAFSQRSNVVGTWMVDLTPTKVQYLSHINDLAIVFTLT